MRRTPWTRVAIGLATIATVAACSATTQLSRKDVLAHHGKLDQLNRSVVEASGQGADLLAPETFKAARQHLEAALSYAQRGEDTKADQAAQRGSETMTRVRANIMKSREVLSEVLETRERAAAAGAPALFSKRFRKADDTLKEQSLRVAQGETHKARSERSTLIADYAQLELDALKKGKLEAARQAVKEAEKDGADDYAQRTLERAKQELELLVSIIEADRTQTTKAEAQAKRTIWIANQAKEIGKLAKNFDDQDLDHEGIILWYQQQLLAIRKPLKDELPFDKPNATVVGVLRQDFEGLLDSLAQARKSQEHAQIRIAGLRQEMEDRRVADEKRLKKALRDLRSGKEARIAELQRKLADQESKEAIEQRRREAERQRFEDVRALFSAETDGEVLRKGQNVILRLHGFDFPSGRSTIEARNYSLLNRVAHALNIFPESRVLITGHTDSLGGANRNQALSLERATNVRRFLEETGGISGTRLEASGRGESEPVAQNNTREGRAKNRRIEVVIFNHRRARSARR